MALTSTAMQYPSGELTKSMFPDEANLDDTIEIWIVDAQEKTSTITDVVVQDAAQRAWVYYRAYTAIANAIAMRPSNSSYYGSERQEAWGSDRVTHFSRLASERLAQFEYLIIPAIPESFSYSSNSAVVSAVW